MKEKEQFDLEEIKKKALEQFRSGKSLYGKDGAFAPMLNKYVPATAKAPSFGKEQAAPVAGMPRVR